MWVRHEEVDVKNNIIQILKEEEEIIEELKHPHGKFYTESGRLYIFHGSTLAK